MSAAQLDVANLLAELIELDDEHLADSSSTDARLAELTPQLLALPRSSFDEFARYLEIQSRHLEIDTARLSERIAGRRLLVTGGSGCVGRVLLGKLLALRPAGLCNVDVRKPDPSLAGVDHAWVDVRDRAQLDDVFRAHRPEIVFHLAAQRDPGVAEKAVRDTVLTNVLGTANVIETCRAHGVSQLVLASTGKAMRPYTRDVYATTKKIAEWLLANAGTADDTLTCTAARFTHVVDNSIVLRRFRNWCRTSSALEVHDLDTAFYAQSAFESAELLMCGLLVGSPGRPTVYAITNLGWPIALTDIAIGVLRENGTPVPIRVVGEVAGYEQSFHPVMYDPATSGSLSPLISALEASGISTQDVSDVDAFVPVVASTSDIRSGIDVLLESCREPGNEWKLRSLLDEMASALLSATLSATPAHVVERAVRLSARNIDATTRPVVAHIDKLVRQAAAGSYRAR